MKLILNTIIVICFSLMMTGCIYVGQCRDSGKVSFPFVCANPQDCTSTNPCWCFVLVWNRSTPNKAIAHGHIKA